MMPPLPGITAQTYGRGLEGLIAGATRICLLDGKLGRFLIRGYAIEDLAARASFEEVSHLVLFGSLPRGVETIAWQKELARWRTPPAQAVDVLRLIPHDAHPLAIFRTMLTVAACEAPNVEAAEVDPRFGHTGRILSWSASLAASAVRHLRGQSPVALDATASYAVAFLAAALGRSPVPEEEKAFEASLIVQIEHELHAACLAALVVHSTGADLGSAVLAGTGALSGIRHGGANQLAFQTLERFDTPDDARGWAREAIARGHRFPGFGHRVYKCPDPRARILEPLTEALLRARGLERRWEVYCALRDEVERALGPRGIYANVDGVTGLLYDLLGLPVAAFTIPFVLAIQTGWMAHCMEYGSSGPMIEPGSVYVPS
jgi:citrate synthase